MDVPINQPISQGHKNQGEVRSRDLCPHLSSELLGESGQPLGGTSRRQRVCLKGPDRKKEKVGVHDLLENMESFLEEANPRQLAYPTTLGPRDPAHFSSNRDSPPPVLKPGIEPQEVGSRQLAPRARTLVNSSGLATFPGSAPCC